MARFVAAFCVTAWIATAAMGARQDKAAGQIAGHIIQSDTGAPIAKAEVSLSPQDDATVRALGTSSRIARSASDGSFTFTSLPPGPYSISVSRNGFVPAFRHLSLGASPIADVRVSLVAAGVVAGTIVDDDQDPIARLPVEALSINYLAGDRRELRDRGRATTDDQGNFRIANLLPGSYLVRAGGLIQYSMESVPLKENANGGLQYRDTYYPGTPRVDEAESVDVRAGGEGYARLTVASESTYAISGVVINPGKGPQPMDVQVEKRGDVFQMWSDANDRFPIAGDGSFNIPRLSPGDYTLSATLVERDQRLGMDRQINAGYASVQITNANVQTTITVGRGFELRAKLTTPPPPDSRWRLYLQSATMLIYPADVDAAGHFDIRNAPPGEYVLTLNDNRRGNQPVYIKRAMCNGTDYARARLTLALDETLDCEITAAMDTGQLSGRVTEADGKTDDLVVVVIPVSHELRRIERYTLSAPVKAGRYQLDGAVPGDYFVLAAPAGDDHPYFAVDFADRHRSEALRVTVAPSSATVLDLKPPRE